MTSLSSDQEEAGEEEEEGEEEEQTEEEKEEEEGGFHREPRPPFCLTQVFIKMSLCS